MADDLVRFAALSPSHTTDDVISHIGPLDGIRALSILLVMVSHAGLGIATASLGMTSFFFLSGYLIATLMRREQQRSGRVALGAFYLRRALRILPPLWITILLSMLLAAAGILHARFDWIAIFSQFVLVISYGAIWGHSEGMPFLPLWSLAVEEHYYLVFPVLYICLFSKISGRSGALICIGICAAILGFRFGHAWAGTASWYIYTWSHTRVDAIFAGAALALYRNPVVKGEGRGAGAYGVIFALCLLAVSVLIRDEVFRQTVRYSLQSIAMYFLFDFVLRNPGWLAGVLSSRPARFVGDRSYALYLCHLPIMVLVGQYHLSTSVGMRAAISIAIAFLYASIMYVAVERPLARLRKRLHRVPAARTAAKCAPSEAFPEAVESRP